VQRPETIRLEEEWAGSLGDPARSLGELVASLRAA